MQEYLTLDEKMPSKEDPHVIKILLKVDQISFYQMDQKDLFNTVFIVSLSNKMLSRMRMSLCLILSLTWATN